MRESTKIFLWSSAAFVAGVLSTVAVDVSYERGGFIRDTVDTAFKPPYSPTKYLIWVIFALVFLAVPFGIREMVADRRFVKEERAMREARPLDAVTEYVGPEGRGYLFDGPGGRTLLLAPVAGLGAPRIVELPPVPPAAEDVGAADASTPMGDAPPQQGGSALP